MKKAFRIIIPLVLVFAVIACAAWYLLVYDREFTRDLLLSQARKFEESGNHQTAAWLYDLAYEHSSQDDDVAIELAMQYRDHGNYSKAEYTLYRAISDGGSAKLYNALSRIYIEQNKLLDAVTMLDTIMDPEIRAELDAQRPAAPTADIAPGFYNQYITVQLSGDSGRIYAATGGEYPSVNAAPCTDPMQLSAGETTILALAVGDNGLVSKLAIYSYTIGGIVEPVHFQDEAMEALLRQELMAGGTRDVYTDELWTVSELTVPAETASYADLVHMTGLKKIVIENGISEELGYLAGLTNLEEIVIVSTKVSEEDLAVIAALPGLKRLTLADCGLSSVSGLSGATRLEYLNLNYNTLRNLTPLTGMSAMQELYISNNVLTDLSALGTMAQLRVLDVSHNALTAIDPVFGLSKLQSLNAASNTLKSLGSINRLTDLVYLSCGSNQLTDISALAGCTKLQELNISDNQITDILSLAALDQLTYFNFSKNLIPEMPAFAEGIPLVTIDGSHNLLNTLEQLSGMKQLNNVLMDYNEELETVEPLKTCPRLIQVNVYGTKVSDVVFLLEQDVIVNFDPTLAG